MQAKQRKRKQSDKSKSLNYASSKDQKSPFKRGNFEVKKRFNTVTPKMHTMTHDFLFRNVYKKPPPLSDEKLNHPTSHYRYKFHHSNLKWKHPHKKHKKHSAKQNPKKSANKDIPFYDDMDKSKKQHFSDDELDIDSSSNDELQNYDNFRKDSHKQAFIKNKLHNKSKWLQSKIKENSQLFEGGLDLQGQLPLKNRIKKRKFVMKNALVMCVVHSIHKHFVKLYLYGSIPGILTIREVSDVLSLEIDHLIKTENSNPSKNSLLDLSKESLISRKRMLAFQNNKRAFYYHSLADLPTMNDIFKRNQVLRCVVTHNKAGEGCHVSLRPSLFNRNLRMNDLICGYCLLCSVQSIEDKGYVMDTGIYVQDKGGENEICVRAFMSYSDVNPAIMRKILHRSEEEQSSDSNDKIPIGFPLECVVKKSDISSNAIWLSLDFKRYYRELTTLPRVPIAALKVGFVVKCFIKRVLKDGLVLEFGKVYQGVVGYSHMQKLLCKKWRKEYRVGEEVSARIVCVHPGSKVIHLSLKPHLVSMGSNEQLMPDGICYQKDIPRRVSEIVSADVRRIAYDSLYLYTKLLDPKFVNKEVTEGDSDSDSDSERRLFPPRNRKPLLQMIPIRVTQKHIKGNLSKTDVFESWKNRRNVRVKLLRFDAFTGEFQGTLKQSEVESKVLFYKDIRYGMVFDCTVVAIDKVKEKIIMEFSNGLRGHISILHSMELPPKSLGEPQVTAKYKKGAILKCKVLTCIAYKKSVNLTAKASLVNPSKSDNKDPMTIYSWNTPANVVSAGVIYKMNDVMGYIVCHFYNSVTAIIPTKDLKANGYLNKPSKEFYIGQTVQVKCVKCDQRNKRMLCSMNLNTDTSADSEENTALYDGTLYWTKIVSKKEHCFIVKKIMNFNENDSGDEMSESDSDSEMTEKNVSFDQLKLYSILPFDHLCDNGLQSMNLVQSNAFEIGDTIQVLTLHRIKVTRSDIERQFQFQSDMIASLGLDESVARFGDTNKKILSIVTAKTGLLRLYRKDMISKVFPLHSRHIQVGDELMGYVSSDLSPSKKHALWLHFGGLLQLPVSWQNVHDLYRETMQSCVKASFAGNESMDDGPFNIYNCGDLVIAKVLSVNAMESEHDETERDPKHFVTLSMKPSVLMENMPTSKAMFFCKTFINEWYLSFKQNQCVYIDSCEESNASDKAVLESLQIGMVLQVRVTQVCTEKKCVCVEFVPSMNGIAKGVINISDVANIGIYKQRLLSKKKFKCNIVNIAWNDGDIPLIGLYDNSARSHGLYLCTVQDSAMHKFVIGIGTIVEKAEIIYVSRTYVLCKFRAQSQDNNREYIGIIPMKLPYLIVPTLAMFECGNECDIIVIQTSNHYGGVILCAIMHQCLKTYIRKCNQTVQSATQKRKLKLTVSSDNRVHKRQKVMEIGQKDMVRSAKSNIMGTVYTADIIGCEYDKKQFIINAKHRSLCRVDNGRLPFGQLCDDYGLSLKLAESYYNILQNGNESEILQRLRVCVIEVSADGLVYFTHKNMIVCHCKDRGYPRYNAYQIGKKMNKIKRNVPIIGYICEINDSSDEIKIKHGNGIVSTVDFDNSLLLPFDRAEIHSIYENGQTVIGYMNNDARNYNELAVSLCRLDKKMENIDIITANQSFMCEFQQFMRAKCVQNAMDISIGQVVDVTVTAIECTVIKFQYLNKYFGEIIRPQHSGAELEAFYVGMETQILVIDLDYSLSKIFGSVRLCTKAPKLLNENEYKSLTNTKNSNVLCQLEYISVCNGYLVLQIVSNNHFIIVPFAIPYFRFTFAQIYNLYFEIGNKFKVTIIEAIQGLESKCLYLGYIPLLTKTYLHSKMTAMISNPNKYYKPFDSRFTHPSQIMYSPKSIHNLKVRLTKTTAQGCIAEFAPDFYPKIVIKAVDNNDRYEILKDESEMNAMIKVSINACKNGEYSNSNRQIIISINDVCDGNEITQETKEENDIDIEMDKSQVRVGEIVDIIIESISKLGMDVSIVKINKKGVIQSVHCSDDIKEIEKLMNNETDSFLNGLNVEIGERYQAVIIDISNKNRIELSIQKSVMQKYNKLQKLLTNHKVLRLDIGTEMNGIISRIVPEYGMFIDLGIFGIGQLHITNCVRNINVCHEIKLKKLFQINEIISTRVIGIDADNGSVILSIKHLLSPNATETPLRYEEMHIGSFVHGIVSMIDAKLGIIVWLSRFIKGRIAFKQLSVTQDISYTMACNTYQIGTIIPNISVLFVSSQKQRVELSLIESDHESNSNNKLLSKQHFLSHKLSEIDIGDFMTVIYQKKLNKNNALFVYVPRSDFKFGIIEKQQISHDLLKNDSINQLIKGDKLQCWVFKIDKSQRTKVYFTMKSKSLKLNKSLTEFNAQQIREIKLQKQQRMGVSLMREYQKLQQISDAQMDIDNSESDSDNDIKPLNIDYNNMNLKSVIKIENETETENEIENMESNNDTNMDIESASVTIKKESVSEKEIMSEENVEWNELMRAEGFSKSPSTPKEFERQIVGSPNSSIIWIEYIAFYLKKQNTVRARNIIDRALKEMAVSEDKERLNIWIAWMNLEVLYGSEETLLSVFKRALQSNDKKDVYTQFVSICEQNKKYDLCNKYYTQMLHKFKSEKLIYINYGTFLYKRREFDKARDLLKRGINNTHNKMQHISLILKFGWNEYKYVKNAQMCQGETMFEGLLKKYSNKVEIWKTYSFAVFKFAPNKNQRLQSARNIYETALSQTHMKIGDTKWLFKQYLNFEMKHGKKALDHKQNVQHIKELAKQYVVSVNLKKESKSKQEFIE